MRLYTLEIAGEETVCISEKEGAWIPLYLYGIEVRDMNELIQNWDATMEQYKNALADEKRRKTSEAISNLLESPTSILAPIITPLQDVICLGVNYDEHILETKNVTDYTKQQDAVYFSKRVNRCNGPDGIIPAYDFVEKLDYEVELGVILKKDAYNVSVEEAQDYILGYTIINDVSARDVQLRHQQWYRGKSLDGYTPMGPCIVTADEIADVHNLSIRCYVNGELRQDSNTKYMITTVEEAIAELSQGMTLQAGTIIATGTPGGVAMGMQPPVFLKPGDMVRCEIEGIGALENRVGYEQI